MLSPEEIEDRAFLVSLRGYDRIEVQGFLAKVAAHVRDLEARLTTAERASAALAHADHDERERVLQAARDEATNILSAAREEAAHVLQAARQEAARSAVTPAQSDPPVREEPPERQVPPTVAPLPRPPKNTAAYERPQGSPGGADSGGTDMMPPATGDRGAGPADPHVLRREALGPLHPQLVQRIHAGLQETRTLVLYRLSRAEASRPPLTVKEVVARLAAAAAELLEAAYRAGGRTGGRLAGQLLDGGSGTSRDLTGAFATAAAEHLEGPITEALGERHESAPVADDRVGAVLSGIEGTVAEELAATQLIKAYELGKLDAWAAGGVSHRRWVLGREPRCPHDRCRRNDEVGEVAVGRPYPSGHDTPPVHVGCTCTTVPVSEPPR